MLRGPRDLSGGELTQHRTSLLAELCILRTRISHAQKVIYVILRWTYSHILRVYSAAIPKILIK